MLCNLFAIFIRSSILLTLVSVAYRISLSLSFSLFFYLPFTLNAIAFPSSSSSCAPLSRPTIPLKYAVQSYCQNG